MDTMGASVSLHGNTAVVGAPFGNEAYLFQENNGIWQQTAKLTEPADRFGPTYADLFGESVAVSDRWAIVCAPESAGDAFFYERDSSGQWTYAGSLQPGGGTAPWAMSLEDDKLLINAFDHSGLNFFHTADLYDAVPVPEPNSSFLGWLAIGPLSFLFLFSHRCTTKVCCVSRQTAGVVESSACPLL